MAIGYDPSKAKEDGDFQRETQVVPEGNQVCRLVSYIEMGHHVPVFMNKPAVYGKDAKRAGQVKDPEMMLHLIYEFPTCEHDLEYPLTLKFGIPYGKNGDMINKIAVSKGIEEGWLSFKFVQKTAWYRLKEAMNDAVGSSHLDISPLVGEAFMCKVEHRLGKKANDDGNIPVYPNFSVDSICKPEFKHPLNGTVEVIDVPEQTGTYCPVFEWDAPTMEAWKEVPKYIKTFIMTAVDFPGSELDMMLREFEEDNVQAESTEEPPAESQGAPAEPEIEPIVDDDIPF